MVTRKINKIIIHCTDTFRGFTCTPQHLGAWHKERGFSPSPEPILTPNVDPAVGYHLYINRKKEVFPLRPLSVAGIHCKGHNHDSAGIVMEGGGVYDGKYPTQIKYRVYRETIPFETVLETAREVVKILKQLELEPKHVFGHGELQEDKFYCPGIDMNTFRLLLWYIYYGI